MFTGKAFGAPLKMHILHRNEVFIGKPLHPLHAHVAQSLVPELTGSVGSNVHFFRASPGIHEIQRVDFPGRATIRLPLLNFMTPFRMLPV